MLHHAAVLPGISYSVRLASQAILLACSSLYHHNRCFVLPSLCRCLAGRWLEFCWTSLVYLLSMLLLREFAPLMRPVIVMSCQRRIAQFFQDWPCNYSTTSPRNVLYKQCVTALIKLDVQVLPAMPLPS